MLTAAEPSEARFWRGAKTDRAVRWRELRRRAALVAVISSFVIGPGLFGAVAPVSVMTLGMALVLALLLAPASRATTGLTLAAWGVIIAFAGMLVVAVAQLALFHAASGPDSLSSAGTISPEAAGWLPITFNSAQTERALGAILVNLMAYLAGLRLASTPERAWTLVACAAVAVAAWTALTLVLFLVDPGWLLWLPKRAYLDSLTGPFVNRNTAAAFFGLGLLCLAGAWREAIVDLVRRPGRGRGRRVVNRTTKIGVLATGGLLLVALMLTRSRAGIVLSLGSAGGFVTVLCYRGELRAFRHLRPRLFWSVLVAGSLACLLALTAAVDIVGQRGVEDGGRLAVYAAGLGLVAERPLWGFGLGAFADIFPSVRPAQLSSWGVWDRAHNTVLEIMIELGIPVAALVVVAALAAFTELVRGAAVRQRHAALPALGAAAGLLFGLHSLVDFPLQIPGLAAMVFMVLGATMAQTRPELSRRGVVSASASLKRNPADRSAP